MSSNFGKESQEKIIESTLEEERIECVNLDSDNEFNEIFDNMESVDDTKKSKSKIKRYVQ